MTRLGLVHNPVLDLLWHVDDAEGSNVARSSTPVTDTIPSTDITPLEAFVIHLTPT